LEQLLTDISYATFKGEGYYMPGGGLGVRFRPTVFRPEPRVELIVEPIGPLPNLLKATPRDIQLFNAEKRPIGTLRDVLADFVSIME
jgi:hypothetical protein